MCCWCMSIRRRGDRGEETGSRFFWGGPGWSKEVKENERRGAGVREHIPQIINMISTMSAYVTTILTMIDIPVITNRGYCYPRGLFCS